MGHSPINGVGLAQHGVGVVQAALLQRGADAGGRHGLPAVLGHGNYVYGDAVGGTELLQQRYIACGVSAKGKVVAAEDRLCMEAVHQHTADKILRREGAELLKGWLPILGDAQLGHAGVLLRQREDTPALQAVVAGQLKGKSSGSQAMLRRIGNGSAQHGAVPGVYAVKIPQRNGTVLRGGGWGQGVVNLHGRSVPFAK